MQKSCTSVDKRYSSSKTTSPLLISWLCTWHCEFAVPSAWWPTKAIQQQPTASYYQHPRDIGLPLTQKQRSTSSLRTQCINEFKRGSIICLYWLTQAYLTTDQQYMQLGMRGVHNTVASNGGGGEIEMCFMQCNPQPGQEEGGINTSSLSRTEKVLCKINLPTRGRALHSLY